MCTVTFLPLGNESFIFTSNRDESKIRPTQIPSIDERENCKLLYPKDILAGGTWICISDKNRVACLMNGAFERHERQLPYRISRGIVLLDLFNYASASEYVENYPLTDVEPFTLMIIENMQITELRWDSMNKHIRLLSATQPRIWSSASLYPKEIRDKREQWFAKWLTGRTTFEQKDILSFHHQGGEGDPENDVVMNRYDIVQTVSVTSIVKNEKGARMYYHDLIAGRTTETGIEFNREQAF